MEAVPAAHHPARAPRSQVLAVTRTVVTSTWMLGALVFALTWGGGMLAPYTPPSLDHSLHGALNMAAVEGLDFGEDLIFTYGPLGFLKSYMLFYESTARLAGLYGIALHLALCVSLVWAIRRNFGAAIAVVLALVIAALARGDELAVAIRDDAAVLVLAFTWSVAALGRDAPELARRVVLYGGGAFAAIEVLAKLNIGVLVLALFAIAAVGMRGGARRNLAILAGSFLATAAVLWFASGQGLGNVGPYLSGSLEVISGYSSGARLEWNDHGYDYWLVPLLSIAALAVGWIATRQLGRRRQALVLIAIAMLAYSSAKSGFVSHDIFHMATTYTLALAMLVVVPLPPGPAWLRPAVLACAVVAVVAASTTSFKHYPMTNPVTNLADGAKTALTLIDGNRLSDRIDANRAHLQYSYGLDPQALAELEGQSVHVDPSEASLAWAYELDWEPLPVFQPYVAWTEGLDRENAEATASAEGPDRIIRQNLNALGRFPAYESPAAMLAMLCNFEELHTTPDWQILGRTADRCGEPRPLGSSSAAFGEPIAIPAPEPGEVVFARAHGIEVSGLERLRAFAFRSKARTVSFEGDLATYNFIPGTAEDTLLVAAAPGIDFPEPFTLAPDAESVTFTLDGAGPDEAVELDFYAMPVERR